jgi:hypothetical protein
MKAYPAPRGDGLDIPAFLRVTMADMPARKKAWDKVKLTQPAPLIDERYKEMAAKQKEAKRQAALARFAKLKARKASKNGGNPSWLARRDYLLNSVSAADYTRMLGEMPDAAHRKALEALFKFDGKRWVRLTSGQRSLVTPKATPNRSRAAGPCDDLTARLAGMVRSQLLALAKVNGVYKPEYEALPNDGLVRMTTGNRLRAMVRRGETLKWE